MKKQKNTKRALIMSLLSLMLCVSMLIGSTFAWFTDSVTSGNNIIKSGSLDIVMEYWDGTKWVDAEGKMLEFRKASTSAGTEVLWEPGCTYELPKIRVRNEGNLAAKILMKLNGVKGDEKLLEAIDLQTKITNMPDSVLNGSYGAQLGKFNNATVGLMYGTPDGTIIFDWSLMGKGVVSPNSGHTDTSPEFTIYGHMKEEAGNEYQELSIEGISITVLATQEVYEYDSFDREYDKNSPFPEVATATIGGNESITAGNVKVTLPSTAPEADHTLKVDNLYEEKISANETTVALNIELIKDGVKVEAEPGKEYTVDIDMGDETIIITGVTHNGETVTNYSYNQENHILTFTTDSFSPFAVSYSTSTYRVSTIEELQEVLTTIRTSAKQQIPSPVANKAYRENAIIVLEKDIVIDGNTEFMYADGNGAPLHFYGVKGVLDLNGHNITVSSDALLSGKAYANAVLLVQYSNIDIIGEGSIIAENKSIPVYGWANSTINIYGGNYVTNASERNESAVYVNNNTVMIHVYGGTYTDSKYAFNVHDNCGSTTVIMLHEGITYDDFLKSGTTDVIQSDLINGRIVIADGCEIVKNDSRNVVTAK